MPKATITKTEFDALHEVLQKEYQAEGDGYKLKIDGGFLTDQDPSALLRAKQHEADRRKESEKKLKEFQDAEQKKIDDAKAEAAEEARKKALEEGDVGTITTQLEERISNMQAKFEKDLADRDAELEGERQKAREMQITSTAAGIAQKICLAEGDYAGLLAPRIAAQLTLNESGQLAVLGADGQIDPQMNLQTLEKSYVDNPAYAAMIAGTKARGASGTPTTGGTPVETAGKKWSDLTSEEKVALKRSNPDAYSELLKTK